MSRSSQPSRSTSSQSKLEKFLKIQRAIPSAIAEVNQILDDYGLIPELRKLKPISKEEAEETIIHIFHRFHRVATTQKEKGGERVFTVKDEKETQDLLHGLLRLHFDDVRKEEATETVAGGSTSIDFLLPDPEIGIEIKMGYVGNNNLRKQINDDKGCYVEHKRCKLLLVFIYDPDYQVKNPKALERQLSRKMTELETKVYVLPKP